MKRTWLEKTQAKCPLKAYVINRPTKEFVNLAVKDSGVLELCIYITITFQNKSNPPKIKHTKIKYKIAMLAFTANLVYFKGFFLRSCLLNNRMNNTNLLQIYKRTYLYLLSVS